MKACPSALERLIRSEAIAEVTAGTGTAAGTAKFRVWGFHPLLRVMVYVFYRVKALDFSGGPHTWTATAIKKDGQGQLCQLQPIFSARTLQDGQELNSGAAGVEYTCALGDMASGSRAGTWVAEIWAKPEHPMDEELFTRLCQQLTCDFEKVLQLKGSAT